MSAEALGAWGERLAERFLAGKGYSILARNCRLPGGEIDLIAEQAGTIVFVEVKTRASRAYGPPEESITRHKKLRLQRAAWAYLQEEQLLQAPWRIDVIAIEGTRAAGARRIDHYVNAIDEDPDLA